MKIKKPENWNKLVKKLIKERRKFFAICRNSYTDELFFIEFKNKKQLERFILKNHGDIEEIGFYASAFVDGKFYDENT